MSIIRAILEFIRGLFSNGSWGIYLALTMTIGGFLLERGHMKSRIAELKSDIDIVQAESLAKDETIQSQARMADRRYRAATQQNNLEDSINEHNTTHDCANSPAVMSAIAGLRERSKSKTDSSGE